MERIDPGFSTEAESRACAEGSGGDTEGCGREGSRLKGKAVDRGAIAEHGSDYCFIYRE